MTGAADTAERAERIDEARILEVAQQAAIVRWQVMLTALIIAAIAWISVPPAFVLVWIIAVAVTVELRSRALQRVVQERTRPIAQRMRSAMRWTALAGACRGAAALFIGHIEVAYEPVLLLILVSWGAGSLSNLSPLRASHTVYVGLIYVPTALMWLLTGTGLGAGIALLVILLFVVQLRMARRVEQKFVEAANGRLDNEYLSACLASERAQLAQARDAAVQANQAKSRFLAAASHDLRQPLQALTLSSGEMVRLPVPPEAKGLAVEIADCVEQLRSMLDALLDVSKMDAGVVVAQPRRVRVDVLVRAVAASFRAAAAQRGIELVIACDSDVGVISDPDLLQRLLANLIDNGIKFTERGEVRVQVAASEEWVDFAVSDTGRGIAPEDQSIVFEDLVQLAQGRPGARPAGHGLGLGIVRRAAALLGTQVTLESNLGAGATFRWRLVRAPTDAADSAAIASGWSLADRRVILLDDAAMVRGAYVNSLARVGAVPCPASTIAEALQHAADADVGLVDWRLAEAGDGFDAIGQLRALRPGLPVVMVTADTGPAIAALARQRGVSLLRKPVSASTLGRALAEAIDAGAPVTPSGGGRG